MMERNLAVDLDFAIKIVQEAGRLQVERRDTLNVGASKAHVNDVVSDVDLASETLIVDQIRLLYPDDAIIGEEGSNYPGSSGWRWVIDPLDGTRNYISRSGPWSVLIALRHGDESKVGVVHDPIAQETFSAIEGRGAYLNGEAISVSSCSRLDSALVAISFDPSIPNKERVGTLMSRLLPAIGDFRRLAAGLHLAYLACGRLDCAYILDVKLWDLAAGTLIASEAGAWIGDGKGGPWSPGFTLAATPSVSSEFSSTVTTPFTSSG